MHQILPPVRIGRLRAVPGAAILIPALMTLVLWLTGCAETPGENSGSREARAENELRLRTAAGSAEDQSIEPPRLLFSRGQEGDSVYLQDPEAAVFDSDGRLHLLDSGSRSILTFGLDGALIRTQGGHGEGPGELQTPRTLTLLGDTLWVTETLSGRLTGFPVHGGAASTRTVSGTLRRPGNTVGPGDGRSLLTPASLFIMNGELTLRGPGGFESDPELLPVYRIDLRDGVGRSAYDLPVPDVRSADGTAGITGRAFYRPALWRPIGRGLAVTVESPEYRLYIRGADGRVIREINRPIDPSPVSDADRDWYVEREVATRVTVGSPQPRNSRAEIRRTTTFEPVLPTVLDALGSPGGGIWVLRRGDVGLEPGAIDRFDLEGRYLGTLPTEALPAFPLALSPDGRRIAVIDRGPFDEPILRVYEVPTEPGSP